MPTLFRDDPSRAPSSQARSRAKALRRRTTEPEKRLWWHLRHRLPSEGTHFRRQVPIDGYIVDFCCLGARLIIEVDGNQHGFEINQEHDARRTRELEARGYRVLRFSDREVMTSIDVVLDTIFAALGPVPSPGGEGRLARRASGMGGAGVELDVDASPLVTSSALNLQPPELGPTPPTPNPSPQGGGEKSERSFPPVGGEGRFARRASGVGGAGVELDVEASPLVASSALNLQPPELAPSPPTPGPSPQGGGET